MLNNIKLQNLVSLMENDLIQDLKNGSTYCEPNVRNLKVNVTTKRKYTNIDIANSGRYMIENSTGIIYGIKGYGQVNKNHVYGTLDTITNYFWGTYTARKLKEVREVNFNDLNSIEQELINIENAKFEAEVIDTMEETVEAKQSTSIKNSVAIQLEKDIAYLEATKERRESSRAEWKYTINKIEHTKLVNNITSETIEYKCRDRKADKYLLIHKKDNVIIYYKITNFSDCSMYAVCMRDGDEYEENWQEENEKFVNDNSDYTLSDLINVFNACGDAKINL